jgi:hypothetical protein
MVSGYFQLQDFYVAGGACDLGGALLLAHGLINGPAELTRLSGSFYGSNAYQAVSVAKNGSTRSPASPALASASHVQDLTVDVTQTAEFPYPRTRRASEPPLEGEPPPN